MSLFSRFKHRNLNRFQRMALTGRRRRHLISQVKHFNKKHDFNIGY
jgi:hypothetical protein